MRVIDWIVVHCAATPNGRPVTVDAIDRMHQQRGFHRSAYWLARLNPNLLAIGYHFLIDISGDIHTGRHLDEIGAHVQGYNAKSVGICMAGTDQFTREQWNTLATLVRDVLQPAYPDAGIRGHRDFSPDQNRDGIIEPFEWLKTCPGFDVATWVASSFAPSDEHVL